MISRPRMVMRSGAPGPAPTKCTFIADRSSAAQAIAQVTPVAAMRGTTRRASRAGAGERRRLGDATARRTGRRRAPIGSCASSLRAAELARRERPAAGRASARPRRARLRVPCRRSVNSAARAGMQFALAPAPGARDRAIDLRRSAAAAADADGDARSWLRPRAIARPASPAESRESRPSGSALRDTGSTRVRRRCAPSSFASGLRLDRHRVDDEAAARPQRRPCRGR